MALTPDTVLNDRYTIQRTLDEAGTPFAVAYLARDDEQQQDVLLTEYFPPHLAERADDGSVAPKEGREDVFAQGLKYFRKEAGLLRDADHANLARETEDFRARGTAYRVSEHRAGASLATALEKNDGRISENAALTVMKPVLGALHAIHREGLLHGGLSPEAVYLTNSRKVLLRGFRGAQLQLARKTDALGEVVVPGLSPAEQYDADGRQGPWTDVYAAAALLYRAATGETLPEARPDALDEALIAERLDGTDRLSDGVKRVLKEALAPRPRARMQSARAFREVLEDPSKLPGDSGATPAAAPAAAEGGLSVPDLGAEAEGGEGDGEAGDEMTPWGPASIAAAAAEAAKKDKEKVRAERAARGDRPPAREAEADGEDADGEDAGGVLPVSNRAAMGGGAALLVLLLLGAGLLFLGGGESNAEGSSNASYNRLVAEGDSLYEQDDLQAASELYQQAQEVAPEEAPNGERVTERLLMIDRLQDAVSNQSYEGAMSRGDTLMARAERKAESGAQAQAQLLYEQAGEAYFEALDSRRRDSLARARVVAVNTILEGGGGRGGQGQDAETSVEEERERLFTRYRDQGDDAFENEDFETARRKFREALEYRPNDSYVTNRLDDISERVSAVEQQAQYQRYRGRADSLFRAGQLEDARREYQLALDVRPGDAAATGRVSTIEERLAQRRRNEEQYQQHRTRGDVLRDDGRLEEAVASYEQALEYRPEDEYVQGRLDTARQQIAAAEQQQQQQEAVRRANQTADGIYKVTDEPATIVGGKSAFYDQITYPSRARRRGVEGRVYLRLTIGADGAVQNAQVVRGIGYGADEEARRAAQAVEFNPATVDGEPVPSFKTLMVPFQIRN